MTVILNGSAMYPDRYRPFPVRCLADGTPCIVGSAAAEASVEKISIFVHSPSGGRTTMHALPNLDEALYEIHLGDYVAVYEPDLENDLLAMYTFRIMHIGPVLATGFPVVI